MKKGRERGLIVRDSVKNIVYLVPCIYVQKGNLKNIREFKDLTRGGIRVAIGNSDLVYIGMLALLTPAGLQACTKVSRLS
jgi:ABC-type sulfate transport system substrate-binding protein